MESRTVFAILVIIALFTSFVSAGFAAAPTATRAVAPPDANQTEALSYPYQAEITANNVNIRSGPGTNYYRCGQLFKGNIVTVVARKLIWSRIVPPKGSFSWISKQYVNIDLNNPDYGTVTGDNVRVWAGSDEVRAIDSAIQQTRLLTGDKVKLLGEESDDYCKIAPPENAYLYILTEYTTPLAGAPAVTPQLGDIQVQPGTEGEAPAVVPTRLLGEAEKINQYRRLEEKVNAEREKALAAQDYSELKKSLTELAGAADAGKAARYAEYTLGQIKRYELAKTAYEQVAAQEQQLKQIEARIEKARAEKLAKIEDLGRFAAIGILKTSALFDPQTHLRRYRVIGNDGTIICYAAPTGAVAEMDLAKYLDQKVGLVGKIEPYVETKNALVRFSQITPVK